MISMEILIKKASQNELEKASILLTELIKSEVKYDKNLKENITITNFYEHPRNNSILFFAYDNEKIVGYIYGFIEDDQLLLNKTAKLDALYIVENYRGNKIGNKLIEEFKTWCNTNNVKFIEVTAWNDNINANKLYLKHGFVPEKTTYIHGYKPKCYQKLVRDKIPEKIRNNNEEPIIRVLDEKEYIDELEKKLYEEYTEVLRAEGEEKLEELGDLLEVIIAIAEAQNKTLEDIIKIANEKRIKRGAFKEKIYLEGTK